MMHAMVTTETLATTFDRNKNLGWFEDIYLENTPSIHPQILLSDVWSKVCLLALMTNNTTSMKIWGALTRRPHDENETMLTK